MKIKPNFKLKAGKVYILPTGFGFLFMCGAAIMLLVGATYANNLINLLAFYLISLTLVSMVQTHNNLKNLEIQQCRAEGSFAGGLMGLTTVVHNPSRSTRYQLKILPENWKKGYGINMERPLGSHASSSVRGSFLVPKRGVYRLNRIQLTTVFPLGLFRAWSWHEIDVEYLVYPQPQGDLPFPWRGSSGIESTRKSATEFGDDFSGHRLYQQGDSPRSIDWKAHARGRPLLVKQFEGGETAALNFSYSHLTTLEPEKRLSQICQWVEIAHRKQQAYSLSLPTETISAGHHHQHYIRCLEALARFVDPTSALGEEQKSKTSKQKQSRSHDRNQGRSHGPRPS